MQRLLSLLVLGAIVIGIAGLAFATERSSAQQLPSGARFDLDCTQTVDPTGAGTKGEVTCSLSVDLPDNLPLDDLALTIVATYVDVDGDGQPSPGDQLQCVTVTDTNGNEVFSQCRSD